MPMRKGRTQKKATVAREKATRKKGAVHFKNFRKRAIMHCKFCGGAGHNKKGCHLNQLITGAGDEDGTPGDGGQNKKKLGTKRKGVGTSIFQQVQANPGGDFSRTTPAAQTQPPGTSGKLKKFKH
ncbi:hypothetical protein LIER_09432 [Lithospermum erythrorhizon]|uniref:Uncharacterized protein n=1 Tax=Lithospermum erythrorhizon TaxID=34254 RepID=A0AAV3PFS1_LITER